MATKKKMTMYLPEDVLNQTKQEALRHDCSMSSIMEMAWRIAREQIEAMPGVDDMQELAWDAVAERRSA
jgi:uncharacterized small protein (TIGR04563 family)